MFSVARFGTLAVLALSVALLHACSGEQTTGPEDQTKTPRVGSTYVFHRYQADTLGEQIPGSGDTAVTSLVNTSAQHAGQTSVFVFSQGSDTVARLRYESSGNVLYYPNWASALGSGWITLPVATKGSTERTLVDTTVDIGGGQSGQKRVTLSVAYVSSQKVAVGSDSLETHRVKLQIVDVNPLAVDLSLIDTTTHTLWYAPTIGYFARQEIARSQQQPYNTIVFETEVRVLTGYTL